jgi:hypothetical protein
MAFSPSAESETYVSPPREDLPECDVVTVIDRTRCARKEAPARALSG